MPCRKRSRSSSRRSRSIQRRRDRRRRHGGRRRHRSTSGNSRSTSPSPARIAPRERTGRREMTDISPRYVRFAPSSLNKPDYAYRPDDLVIAANVQSAKASFVDLSCLPKCIEPAWGKGGPKTIALWCRTCESWVGLVRKQRGFHVVSTDGGCKHFHNAISQRDCQHSSRVARDTCRSTAISLFSGPNPSSPQGSSSSDATSGLPPHLGSFLGPQDVPLQMAGTSLASDATSGLPPHLGSFLGPQGVPLQMAGTSLASDATSGLPPHLGSFLGPQDVPLQMAGTSLASDATSGLPPHLGSFLGPQDVPLQMAGTSLAEMIGRQVLMGGMFQTPTFGGMFQTPMRGMCGAQGATTSAPATPASISEAPRAMPAPTSPGVSEARAVQIATMVAEETVDKLRMEVESRPKTGTLQAIQIAKKVAEGRIRRLSKDVADVKLQCEKKHKSLQNSVARLRRSMHRPAPKRKAKSKATAKAKSKPKAKAKAKAKSKAKAKAKSTTY